MTEEKNSTNSLRVLNGRGVSILLSVVFIAVFYLDYLLAKSFIWEDALLLAYPHTNYILKALASGRIPLWLPNFCNGTPYLGALNAVCYLPNWLMLPFMSSGMLPILVYQWYLVLHVVLGAGFMYLFLREHKLAAFACATGAIVFVLSGFGTLHIVHPSFLQAYIWVPLQLLLVRRAVATRKAGYYLALVPALAMSLNAGHTQIALYTSYLVVAYWCFCLGVALKTEPATAGRIVLKNAGTELTRMVLVFGAVLGLCAVAILPSLETMRLSTRDAWGLREMADQSLPPYYLMQFLAPKFFGTTSSVGSLGEASRAGMPFWGADKTSQQVQEWSGAVWQYWEFGGYAGQIALFAVIALLLNIRRLTHKREVLFFLGASALALWFMLGRYAGLFGLLYHVLPGVSLFRIPPRMACVLDFSLAMLAACLVDEVLRAEKFDLKKSFIVLAAGYVVALFGYTALARSVVPQQMDINKVQADAFQQLSISIVFCCVVGLFLYLLRRKVTQKYQVLIMCGLLAVVFADLFHAHSDFHSGKTDPTKYYADRMGLAPQLAKLKAKDGPFRVEQLRDGVPVREFVYPQAMPLFYDAFEFTEGYVPWFLKDFFAFRHMRNKTAQLDIEGARVLLNYDTATQQLNTFENRNCLPRATFYSQLKPYPSAERLIQALEDGELDYHRQLGVLESDAASYRVVIENSQATTTRSNRVFVVEHRPEQYRIGYHVEQPGVVFVSETFYPGWEVSNKPFKVIRAFGSFMGIVIPTAGEGELILRFNSPTVRTGLLISSVTLAGLLGIGVFLLLKPKS